MATYSAFFSSGLNAPRELTPPYDMDCDTSEVERRSTPGADSTNIHASQTLGHSKSRSRSSSITSNGGGGKTLRKRRSSLTLGSMNPTLSAIKSPSRAAGTAFKHMSAMSLGHPATAHVAVAAPGQVGTKGRVRSGSLGGALRRSNRMGALPPPPPTAPLPPLPPLPSLFPSSAPPSKLTFGAFSENEATPKRPTLGLPSTTLPHRTRSFQAAAGSASAFLGAPVTPQRSYSDQGSVNTSYYNPSPSSPILPSSPIRPDSPMLTPGKVMEPTPLSTPEKSNFLNIPPSSAAQLSTPEREKWGRARAYSFENGYRIHEDLEAA